MSADQNIYDAPIEAPRLKEEGYSSLPVENKPTEKYTLFVRADQDDDVLHYFIRPETDEARKKLKQHYLEDHKREIRFEEDGSFHVTSGPINPDFIRMLESQKDDALSIVQKQTGADFGRTAAEDIRDRAARLPVNAEKSQGGGHRRW